MKRFVIAVVLAAVSASAAMAGPIEDRAALMKGVQAATKDGIALAHGTAPWDAAKAKSVTQVYIDAAAKLPAMFPAGTEKGGTPPTMADPKIWSDSAGFKAAAMKFGADAKVAQGATDAASFNTAFTKVVADCSACHGAYRMKPQ